MFRCQGTPLDEMKRLQKLQTRDPESAANLVENGKLLVNVVHNGNLRALHCAAEQLEEGQVLLFYAVRMFREACAARRLDILRFMLQNGFDLQQCYVEDILHSIIESVDSNQSANVVQPLIRLLLDAGVDVNWQRKSDLYTALHVACCKTLYPIAFLLVLYGADVNAIAADDAMPLSCVCTIGQATKSERMQKESLVHFLVANQARASWRKQICQVSAASVSTIAKNARPVSPEYRQTSGTHFKRPILSFSSSFGIQCSVDKTLVDQNQAGIMFDTSDLPANL